MLLPKDWQGRRSVSERVECVKTAVIVVEKE